MRGAKAQEEDLAVRHSTQPSSPSPIDQANRATDSMLYTIYLIHSPDVPFIRDERLELLETPFVVSIVTSPAPNAGEALKRDPNAGPRVKEALLRRAGHVLAAMADQGHRHLVLGAWGCGVFQNDPTVVANAFADWLDSPVFQGAFERVVFAVYDGSKERPRYRAFEKRFGAA